MISYKNENREYLLSTFYSDFELQIISITLKNAFNALGDCGSEYIVCCNFNRVLWVLPFVVLRKAIAVNLFLYLIHRVVA